MPTSLCVCVGTCNVGDGCLCVFRNEQTNKHTHTQTHLDSGEKGFSCIGPASSVRDGGNGIYEGGGGVEAV